jgi:hypothetical protein
MSPVRPAKGSTVWVAAAAVLHVTLDDDDDVVGVDEDPMMRTAPLGVVSGAVVGVLAVLSSG